MMPMRTAIVSLMFLTILPTPLFAQTSHLPEPDKDPFVGTWKANAEKSRPNLDEAEASYVVTISRNGDDRVISSRTKRPFSGGFSENHYSIRCDGIAHRVQCGVASCTTSCAYKAATRVEGDTVSPDRETSYWTQEVSSDGQEMRIYSYRNAARTKVKRVEVRDRVK